VGRPQLVTQYRDFVRTYGGAFDFGATFAGWEQLPHAVRGFFANGGRRAYIMRVAPASATRAFELTRGGIVTRLLMDVPALQTTARLATLRGLRNGASVQFRMVKDGVSTVSAALNVTGLNRATNTVSLSGPIHATVAFEARYTTVNTNIDGLNANGTVSALATPTSARPASFTLRATSVGSWGLGVRVAATHASAARSVVLHAQITAATNRIPVLSTAGFYTGAWVEFDRGDGTNDRIYRQVTAVDGTVLVVAGAAFPVNSLDPTAPLTETRVSSCEFSLTITYEDPAERTQISERFEGLTMANVPGRYYVEQLQRSRLVEVDTATLPAVTHPFFFPSADDGLTLTLTQGGADGTAVPTVLEVQGTDLGPNQRTGLLAMEEVDEVSILAAPGLTGKAIQDSLIEQCERLMDRFAVLDPVVGAANSPATLQQIQDQRNRYDTRYAALYYPRVVIADPLTNGERPVAPSGHVIGVYARVDNTRGVHKSPANEVIRGILDVETVVTRGVQEILNPLRINVLRDLRADRRGLRVYGGRCLTSEMEWVYVNVRRLFIFLEESLDEGLQWSVFEPNDERLWARIRRSVGIFLTRVWMDGALMGAAPEEAFFVICDRSTMTDDDILNGRVIVEIGVAPVRPAEFVVIRIGQWLGGSATQEL
jgi:hypothetical protein